jgi:hypothetical protein
VTANLRLSTRVFRLTFLFTYNSCCILSFPSDDAGAGTYRKKLPPLVMWCVPHFQRVDFGRPSSSFVCPGCLVPEGDNGRDRGREVPAYIVGNPNIVINNSRK